MPRGDGRRGDHLADPATSWRGCGGRRPRRRPICMPRQRTAAGHVRDVLLGRRRGGQRRVRPDTRRRTPTWMRWSPVAAARAARALGGVGAVGAGQCHDRHLDQTDLAGCTEWYEAAVVPIADLPCWMRRAVHPPLLVAVDVDVRGLAAGGVPAVLRDWWRGVCGAGGWRGGPPVGWLGVAVVGLDEAARLIVLGEVVRELCGGGVGVSVVG